jgi:hypothetical protein
MRLIGLRLPILAVLMLASSSVPTRAQVLYLETADWLPTASVLALPTSYVVAGTYAVPTSYTIPTVYATAYVTESALLAPTTYVAPTYYETRFRRRGLFGRRLVETTRAYYLPTTAYYPTTYYYPTTFYSPTFYSPTVLDTAVVTTGYTTARSSDCCGGETIVAAAPAVRMYPSEQTPVATTPAPRTNTRSRTSPIQSEPAEDDSINSNVPELPPREPAPRSDASGAAAGQSDSPPNPPVPAHVQSSAPRAGADPAQTKAASPAAGSPGGGAQPRPASPNTSPTPPASPGGVERPTAPAGLEDLERAPGRDETSGAGSGGQSRVVQKPVLPTSRDVRSQYRNVLFGRVKTRDTNEPEEGVRVTISNRANAYADRVALTDAFGRFAVKVPDGDWTVNVTMPSGRAYSVSRITVSNGLISDDIGRDIPSLVITR